MIIELTNQQEEARAGFRAFVNQEVVPRADQFDREELIPRELVQKFARQRYLGAILPLPFGGDEMDMLTFGLLCEEVGRGCSSLRSLLTVHTMVAWAILRWGSKEQRDSWLPRLASGETLAAFALTEPEVGSDAGSVKSSAQPSGQSYILTGRKKWITFGQIADLFLVFTQCEGKATACLVERNTSGLSLKPISGMLGVRGSMLAQLDLEECRIPKSNLVGREGFGFSHVASTALDLGRYTVAWGCVGIGQACLEASLEYTSQRQQFGVNLKEHQLIRQMISDMIVEVKAARLLCLQAGYLKQAGDPRAVMETSIAKYFASTMAARTASNAVQIHGASGCSREHSVERYLRDSKIMEIIEGSTQMQQITIADYGYQEYMQ